MANINVEIEAISEAVYGEEVRSSIVEALSKLNQHLIALESSFNAYQTEVNNRLDTLEEAVHQLQTQPQVINIYGDS